MTFVLSLLFGLSAVVVSAITFPEVNPGIHLIAGGAVAAIASIVSREPV